MKIYFEPKVILGSLFGIISTIVTITIVFFPNVFNMQKEKIISYKTILETEKDYIKFINFLKDNSEKIIKLEIKYFEEERFVYTKNGRQDRILFDREVDHDFSGDELFSEIDPLGHIFVFSKYRHIGPYMKSLHRTSGGFGIWVRENKNNSYKDTNYYIVIIEDSEENILYKWNISNKNESDISEMELSGIFFVEPKISLDYYDNIQPFYMSKQWQEYSCKGGDCYNDTYVIELTPLSRQELEILNY